MGWPRLIQLHNSEYSHSYNGSEVRETWYVEPFDATTAFIASMLGRVDVNDDGVTPNQTPPARHFMYGWCMATQADAVPFDPRSFSYMGSTAYNTAGAAANRDGMTTSIRNAVQSYKLQRPGQPGNDRGSLDPTADIDAKPITSAANRRFSAGVYICVTYKPVLIFPALTPGGETGGAGPLPNFFDCVNLKCTPQKRTNQINKGLVLVCPPGMLATFPALPFVGGAAGQILAALATLYPDAGIAPVYNEEFQEITLERRMLSPNFSLEILSNYGGKLNYGPMYLQTPVDGLAFPPGAPQPGSTIQARKILHGTLKFTTYESDHVEVPAVNDDGEPNGYSRWTNLVLHYDWRTMQPYAVNGPQLVDDNGAPTTTFPVYDQNANGPPDGDGVLTWNHVLGYPGILHWPDALAWYRAKFSTGAIPPGIPALFGLPPPISCDPYPLITNIGDTINKYF
jgi:hypothetical protein